MAAQGSGSQVFELRPLNIADLLDMVIRVYRRHFGVLMAIAAVVYVPIGALQVVSSSSLVASLEAEQPAPVLPDFSPLTIGGLFIWIMLGWLTMPLMQAAVAKAVSEYYLGGDTSVGQAYRFALSRWLALIMVAILLGLATSVVLVVCLLPAGAAAVAAGGLASITHAGPAMLSLVIMLMLFGMLAAMVALVFIGTKFFFGALSVVLEGRGAFAGLGRSWELTNAHFWRVLGTLSLLWIMVTVAQGIIIWPAQLATFAVGPERMVGVGYAVLYSLSALAQLLCQPFLIIGTVLLYYDLRIRKEGFDLAMMAEAIGEPERAPRAPSGEGRAPLYGPRSAESGAAAPEAPAPPSAYDGPLPPPPPPRHPGPGEEPRDEPGG